MAVILSAKIIFSIFLVLFFLSFFRWALDHSHEFKNANNHEKRRLRLRAREASMRLARFCPSLKLRGFEMLAEDWCMADAEEHAFESYIANLYDEPNHFRDVKEMVTTRYFLGRETWRPTDEQVWKFQERSYGMNHVRDAKEREYHQFLSQQTFSRTSEGYSARTSNFNELQLRQMYGETEFERIVALKMKLDTPKEAATMPAYSIQHDMEWDAINYAEPQTLPVQRKPDYNPAFELGNDILEVVPSKQEQKPAIVAKPIPVPRREEKPDILELLPLSVVLARPTPNG